MKSHYKKFLTYQNFLAAEFGFFLKKNIFTHQFKKIVYFCTRFYEAKGGMGEWLKPTVC